MILPNFIILGAAKAGTTALYHYLQQHPEIGMSQIKETNYLALKDHPLDFQGPGDCDYIKRFTVTTESGYYAQFAACAGKRAIGEASPLYLYDPQVAPAIKQFIPDAKLIVILRNPVDRAYSAFLHLIRDQRETTRDFLTALHLEPSRIADRWEHIWHYVAMGRYGAQLATYLRHFDRNQIRIYLYSDFHRDPSLILTDVYHFLDVDRDFQADCSVRHNASLPPSERPPLLPAACSWIETALHDDRGELEAILHRDLSDWFVHPH